MLIDLLAERYRIMHPFVPKPSRESDGVALQAENQTADARAGIRLEAEVGQKGKRGRGMGGIQVPVNDFISNIRPTRLTLQLHVQVILFEQTCFGRIDQRRAVTDRQESHAQRFFPLEYCQTAMAHKISESREQARHRRWFPNRCIRSETRRKCGLWPASGVQSSGVTLTNFSQNG